MPRERNDQNPDVNSPVVDDDYAINEDIPGTNKPTDIREPEGDDGIGRPDVDEPYPSPEDDGDVYPVTDPPLTDEDTGDVDNL